MGQTVQRQIGPVRALEPGEYTLATASGKPAVCCPKCGTISELALAETHIVLEGGLVTPLWTCPGKPCGFSDFLTLEAWDEPVVP